MNRTSLRAATLACALLASTAQVAPADDQFGASNFCSHANANQNGCSSLAAQIVEPSGLTTNLTWDVRSLCSTTFNPDGSLDCSYAWRLSGVGNGAGYALAFSFVT